MEGFGQFMPIILLFLAMYFLFILPQSKKAKKEKNFIKNVKTGDRVVTKSGMHGKIVEINDSNNTCVLVTMAGKIKFDKSAISFELSESFFMELFHKTEQILWSVLLKPFFFSFDPEKVHHFVVGAMKLFSPIFYFRKSFYHFKLSGKNHPSLEKEVFGIKFPNPVGLAAGFDKNAEVYKQMASLGFGFIEIGTVTPVAQDGNPKKRIFRLVNDNALINRLGFNNDGVDKIVERLRNKGNVIIGGNIGKNKVTPNENAKYDYLICFKALYDYVDYFAVNVSSPNTPNLRDLQNINDLREILFPLIKENKKRETKPILIKISPDLNDSDIKKIVDLSFDLKIDGIITSKW